MLAPDSTPRVYTVSELNRLARSAIERALPLVWIAGEISNLTRAPSGHWYFTLKDAGAAVRCAMFRNRNQFLDWRPDNGMQVEVRAQATLYEPRGEFQLSVEAMRRAGLGALFEAFQRLKEKLDQEGLFDPDRKRALPTQPTTIGVVTSPRAAALRDVLTTLKRRWPLARVVIYPTLVQGTGAADQIARAINLAGTRAECDVLLLVRGGGSIEDLWSFNEERVARAIVACAIPVVSGVGHETDFTIADFAADVRAPTPTGAAQLATPDGEEWRRRVDGVRRSMQFMMNRRLDTLAQRLDSLSRQVRHPAMRLEAQARHLAHLSRRLDLARDTLLSHQHQRLERSTARLLAARPSGDYLRARVENLAGRLRFAAQSRLARQAVAVQGMSSQLKQLNPEAVLNRGYGIVRDDRGVIVTASGQLHPEQPVTLTLSSGAVAATVTKILR